MESSKYTIYRGLWSDATLSKVPSSWYTVEMSLYARILCAFRLRSHRLMIETGTWQGLILHRDCAVNVKC